MLAYQSVQVQVPVPFPFFIYRLMVFYIKASGYLKNIHVWSQHIPDLQIHIRRFLYDQLNPDSEVFGMDVDLNFCPEISLTLHVQVYHLASTIYHAPSDLSGIGGMQCEYIRATPNWRGKGVSWNDCVFVEREPENEGFQALGVAQVQIFLHSAMMVFYIPVHWCVGLKLMVINHVQRLGCGG